MRFLNAILFLTLFAILTTSVITRSEADDALNQLESIGETNDPHLLDKKSILCNDLALFYQSIDDNQQAVIFLQKAPKHSEKRIQIEGNWTPQDNKDLLDLNLNLAKIQSAAGYIQEAEASFAAAKNYHLKLKQQVPDEEFQRDEYNFYGTAFAWAYHAGQLERAESFGRLELAAAIATKEVQWISEANRDLGELYRRLGKPDLALNYFYDAAEVVREKDSNAELAQNLIGSIIGTLYGLKRYNEVIAFMQKEPMYSSQEQLMQSMRDVAATERSSIINNLFTLSYAYIRGYQQNQNQQYLNKAQAWQNTAYQMAESAMFENGVDRLGQVISRPDQKITSTLKNYELLEEAQALSQEEIAQLLRTIDVYHATQLHVNRLKNEINGDNWNKQKELQEELTSLFEQLREKKDNRSLQDSLQNRSFQISSELARLAASTKRTEIFKEYELGQKDFANRLQNYAKYNKKTVVTYFWSAQLSRLYIIGRNPKQYFFKTVEVDASFPELISDSYNLNANFLTDKNDMHQQDSLNQTLYDKLIVPVKESITTDNLLVYPIGIMSYVSMDALRPTPSQYLIEELNTSYTSSLFSLLRKKQKSHYEQEVVAFHPKKYGTDSLAELFYAKDEILLLDSILDVSKFEGQQATKNQFLAKGSTAAIIHVASHSILNSNDPFNSYLIFEASDSAETYQLKASEIFRNSFDADMVVLSSCNSAKGTSQGEIGIISLSNAFYFSGVPTTIGSLWSAQDNSSSKIVQSFYRNVSNKIAPSKSLTKAKRLYLKQSDAIKSQPFFWANYVMYGTDESIVFEQENNWTYYIPFVILFLLIPFAFYKRSRRSLARSK